MSEETENVLEFLDKISRAVVDLTDQLIAQSAARMVHRHILVGLLTKCDEGEVNELLDNLHEFIDGTEEVDGPAWACAYRAELDEILHDVTGTRDAGI